MEKYFKFLSIIGFLFLTFSLSSCDKILEEEPQNKLKPSTVTDYDELLNYGYPNSTDYFADVPLDFYTEIMTDDVNLAFYNSDRLPYPLIPFSFAPSHEDQGMLGGYDQAWKHFYKAIYYANVVFDNVGTAEGSETEKNAIKGEAMILRAFAYFKLINLYGKPYNAATAASDPGVPLKLDPTVQSTSFSRQSVQEIYDQINKDLNEGLILLSDNRRLTSSKYKFNFLSASLLASRVALYQKHYADVIKHSSNVITQQPGILSLADNRFNTAKTWGYGGGIRTHAFADDSPNVLFKYGGNEFYYYFYIPGGLGFSDDLISIYEPGDIRLYYSSYSQGTGRKYNKYQPFANRVSEPIRGFRTEEAYLNRAEAYAETGEMQKALDDLNYLRKAKFDAQYDAGNPEYYKLTATDYPDQPDVIAVTRLERRRELCFEFHRWYDLRRYGMPEIVHQMGSETYVLPAGDPRYVLQLPQRELDYNPDMKPNPR